MDSPEGPEAVSRFSVADVIVVSADHDRLIFEGRIGSLDQSQDVMIGGESLVEGLLGPAAMHAKLFQALDDINSGSPIAAAARRATFEGIVGQHAHMVLDFLGRDREHGRIAGVGFGGPAGGDRRANQDQQGQPNADGS